MSADPIVYKEGMLLKRQRGLHTSNTRKLKFQERFCCLTNTSLDYYDPLPKKRQSEGPKGQFAVEKMKIIEPMKTDIFGREYRYAVQIGDQQEIMYFVTESEVVRDQWLEAFKLASRDATVVMLPQHHHGAYGLLNKGRWSCCANTRRDTIGCSTSSISRKDLTLTFPSPSPSKLPSLVELKTSSLPRNNADTPQSAPPPITMETGVFLAPTIRRFTTTDPLMKPNAMRLRKLRQSVDFDSDKISELDELEEEPPKSPKIISPEMISELDELEKEPPKIISPKKISELEEEPPKSPKVIPTGRRPNGKAAPTIAEITNGHRSGASSPAPSDDSGRGTSAGNSRPNSQIEDNRIRAESWGKKPNQLTILEQKEEEPILVKQEQVEGSADSSKTVTPEVTPVRQRGSIHEETRKDLEKTVEAEETVPDDEGDDELDGGVHKKTIRSSSSPAPFEPALQIIQDTTRRPLSMCSINEGGVEGALTGSGSEMSLETPRHRSLKEKMMNSPRMSERPRSFLVRGFSIGLPQYNQLHQACKDGSLEELGKALGDSRFMCSDIVNLEELSNEEVPHTPLFIAFINDHFQTMVRLLEHGANPNSTESVQKASLLHWACAKGCMDVLDLLVKYKADVNKRDSSGNTPLMLACKNGHMDIVEFLLANGANVESESSAGRTPLHESCESGKAEIVDLLLRVGRADPTVRDQKELSPYDIAFNSKNIEIMSMLQQVTPEIVRPYTVRNTHTATGGQMITSLSFKGNDLLITGSHDTQACFLNTTDLTEVASLHLTDTVLDLAVYDHTHLVLGSTSIQIVDIDDHDKRQTVADDTSDDESLENPPLHLAKFGPQGRLVTASAENNVVKLWPPVVTQTGGIVTMPEAMLAVGEESQGRGSVYCLSVSPSPNCPWLAVGFQPGRTFLPRGNKLVYIYDWERKELKQIFDAGEGGLQTGVYVTFSPCGRFVAIGCAKTLCIWDPKSGDLVQKFTIENGAKISSVTYSPNGCHLATGLSNGEVQVFETSSSSPIFYLMRHKTSPVTAMAYSENGKLFATGQQNGCLQLWEAYGCVVSNSTDS